MRALSPMPHAKWGARLSPSSRPLTLVAAPQIFIGLALEVALGDYFDAGLSTDAEVRIGSHQRAPWIPPPGLPPPQSTRGSLSFISTPPQEISELGVTCVAFLVRYFHASMSYLLEHHRVASSASDQGHTAVVAPLSDTRSHPPFPHLFLSFYHPPHIRRWR